MVSKYKTRAAGQRNLLSVESFDDCFFLCFGVSVYSVRMLPRHSYLQVLYVYGLRKVCGLTIIQIADVLGFSVFHLVTQSLRLAARYLCVFDVLHNVQFKADLKRLKAVCKPFRHTLSSAERGRRYRAKKANDKKRIAKIKATKAKKS